MGMCWEKWNLPEDWTLEVASVRDKPKAGHEYIKNTYKHVMGVYDGREWSHHLGLILGILFSQVAPRLCFPNDATIDGVGYNAEELTRVVRAIPWCNPRSAKKGVTARQPFVPMVGPSIIGLLDEQSPLRLHMMKNKSALGAPWTAKHCKFTLILLLPVIINACGLGAKEINAANLIRIGVAKALKPGVLTVAKHGIAWEMLPDEKLKAYYARLMERLSQKPFGEYFVIQEVRH